MSNEEKFAEIHEFPLYGEEEDFEQIAESLPGGLQCFMQYDVEVFIKDLGLDIEPTSNPITVIYENEEDVVAIYQHDGGCCVGFRIYP